MATSKDLSRMRFALGETQDEFARRFGVNQSTIARWEMYGIPDGGPARLLIDMVLEDIAAPGGKKKREPA